MNNEGELEWGLTYQLKKKIICLISLISFKIDFFVFFQAMTAHTGYNSSALLVHDIRARVFEY